MAVATKAPSSLAEALAKFQQEHHAAGKDGKANYGFYTTLAGGLNAVQPATHLGLCHTQTFDSVITNDGKVITVLVTTLKHVGGEEVVSRLPFPELVPNRGNIMQALGSAVTYARRYALLAIYGLAGDDDDAEGSGSTPKVEQKKGITRTPTAPRQSQFIAPAFKSQIENDLRNLDEVQRTVVLERFKREFKISAKEISPNHITTEAHGDFLAKIIKQTKGELNVS
tara:strand:- start:41 stop:718 length:678 start_codon:yes stop_codon:yes gene_type:complete